MPRPKKSKIGAFSKEEISKFAETLANGGRLFVTGLGVFYARKIKERVGWNPVKKTTITIPAHSRIKYSPSQTLKDKLNEHEVV